MPRKGYVQTAEHKAKRVKAKDGKYVPRLVHGHARGHQPTATWNSWRMMIRRCTSPTATGFHRYGGRGIQVCAEWTFFENFLADMGERPIGMTLDRIDADGNYEPGNCRWATAQEQRINQRPRDRGTKPL